MASRFLNFFQKTNRAVFRSRCCSPVLSGKRIWYLRQSTVFSSTSAIQNQNHAQTQTQSMANIAPSKMFQNKKASLVIFDKDGTLICFHSMWGPWSLTFAKRLEELTGLNIADKVFEVLGYCSATKLVETGVLAEGTSAMVKKQVAHLLMSEGLPEKKAEALVNQAYAYANENTEGELLKPLDDLHTLFRVLKENDIKIAVCTSDSRNSCMQTLESLNILQYIDRVVCGDDMDSTPKPSPFNAQMICQEFNIHPSETVMVGDTLADVGMGRLANLGASIAVTTGVTHASELIPHSDHVVERLLDVVPLILPKNVHDGYKLVSDTDEVLYPPQGPADEMNIGKDAPWTEAFEVRPGKKASLVIFDKNGTLVCFNTMYSKWIKTIAQRLEALSGLRIAEMVYEALGYNLQQKSFGPGIMSEVSEMQVRLILEEVLYNRGMYRYRARQIVDQAYDECDTDELKTLKSLDDILPMFKTLKEYGVKTAVCTSDSRDKTLVQLRAMDVLPYCEEVVCGDDRDGLTKPSPQAVLKICSALGVDPAEAIIVGDSVPDLGMGRSANIKSSVGVLTGPCTEEDLTLHADHIITSVSHILPLVLPDNFRDVFDFHKTNPSGQNTSKSTSKPNSIPLSGSSQILSNMSSKTSPFESQKRSYSTSPSSKEYTHIIVGAGSAGCVLANRLSEDNNSVLLLEAGPEDAWYNWKIHMPAALMYNLCDDKYNWYYETLPQKNCNHRKMYWPRGRVWGGSSSLNAMVYIRGHALDYDRWEKQGAEGWSYADCLPYFRKAQTHELGPDDYRGGDGPLHVSRGKTNNPLFQAFIDAGMEAGYPFTEDMNGYQQEGVGWMDMTIHQGKRWNTSSAYLRPAMKRPNLEIRSRVLTDKVLFDGKKAVGVEYQSRDGNKKVFASKEVILCGGAINSPQLLMLSGVGNADDLKALDIPVVQHLPGVGQNLQDHLELYVQQACTKPITLYSAQWKFPHNMIRIGLQWFMTQKGWGASTHLEAGGFIRSTPGVTHPDIQWHFLPSTVNDHGRKSGDQHAFQVHAGSLRATSVGWLKLKSKNPRDHPLIDPNYLSTESDKKELRDAVRLSREVFAQPAFDKYRGEEIAPGKEVQSDAQLDEWVSRLCDSAYHPSCTCKMGSEEDNMAVVNNRGQVFGIDNLRVVDASIMPSVVSGNLNGPTVMIAEKCADAIRGKMPLPKSNAPVWHPKTLKTQRTKEGGPELPDRD